MFALGGRGKKTPKTGKPPSLNLFILEIVFGISLEMPHSINADSLVGF